MGSTHTQECTRCAQLEARIRELESALEGATFALDTEVSRVTAELGLTRQQAQLLIILWRAGGYVDADTLAEALPPVNQGPRARRLDPDFRSPSHISSVVCTIRRRTWPGIIQTSVSLGYRIGRRHHARLGEVIRGR